MCLYVFKGPTCSGHQLISEVHVKSSMSINSISAEKSERVEQVAEREKSFHLLDEKQRAQRTRNARKPGIFTRYTTKRQKAALMAKG